MSRRGKEFWLDTGLQLLASDGHSSLTVERLCQATGKTKGSFYHHFSGTSEFARQLLQAWRKAHTQDLIDLTDGLPPLESLRKLQELARKLPFDRESAFRTWAARDPEVARVVQEVDATRVSHLVAVHQALGCDADRAQSQAWLEYAVFIGMAQLQSSLPLERRRKVNELLQRSIQK